MSQKRTGSWALLNADGVKKRKVAEKSGRNGKDGKKSDAHAALRAGRELFLCHLAELTTGTLTDGQIKELLKGKTREVQLATCLRPRYAQWGKCTQCVSKVGGDSCRFKDYRVFK